MELSGEQSIDPRELLAETPNQVIHLECPRCRFGLVRLTHAEIRRSGETLSLPADGNAIDRYEDRGDDLDDMADDAPGVTIDFVCMNGHHFWLGLFTARGRIHVAAAVSEAP